MVMVIIDEKAYKLADRFTGLDMKRLAGIHPVDSLHLTKDGNLVEIADDETPELKDGSILVSVPPAGYNS